MVTKISEHKFFNKIKTVGFASNVWSDFDKLCKQFLSFHCWLYKNFKKKAFSNASHTFVISLLYQISELKCLALIAAAISCSHQAKTSNPFKRELGWR